MTEFWMEQRQQIRDRLGDAGWQINLSQKTSTKSALGKLQLPGSIDRPIYESPIRLVQSSTLLETKSRLKS